MIGLRGKVLLFATLGLSVALGLPGHSPAQAAEDNAADARPAITEIVDWQSPLYQDHPLVGAIWQVSEQRFVSAAELTAAILSSQYLLLGEKHDNPDHHRLQHNVLRLLLDHKRVAAVAFEMMDSGFDQRLASPDIVDFQNLDDLRDLLEWDEQGWNWAFYGSLVGDVLQAGVDVRSANISADQVGSFYANPLADNIATVLDSQAIDQLNTEIDRSHCNMLPASQFPAMVRVQQARDHQMAMSLAASPASGQLNVLIAGNYHVRKDLGVPNYLLALQADEGPEAVLSLALLEVDPASDDPKDYLQAFSDTPPFDYVWFTPVVSEADYCASLAR